MSEQNNSNSFFSKNSEIIVKELKNCNIILGLGSPVSKERGFGRSYLY